MWLGLPRTDQNGSDQGIPTRVHPVTRCSPQSVCAPEEHEHARNVEQTIAQNTAVLVGAPIEGMLLQKRYAIAESGEKPLRRGTQ